MFFFIIGLLLLILNLFFMFHWIAIGSAMFLLSFVGAIFSAYTMINGAKTF